MAITPHTNLYLIKCPLEEDNLNQLTFSNRSSQLTYFSNLPHLTVENFTYQRKDNIIRYPEHIDNILNYNYVMYQNENYSNKWFFAFITNMRYINDGMTEITIKTDVYQTWQFDLQFKQSFIEREHTNNDSIGANTIPENLETGDFVAVKQNQTIFKYNNSNCVPVIGVTQLISPFVSYSVANENVPDGLIYIGCKDNSVLKAIIKIYEQGYADSISTVFLAPSSFFSNWQTIIINGTQYESGVSTQYKYDIQDTYEYNDKPNTLELNYNPVNKKLLCYPFCFLQVSNNAGQTVNYKYEDFRDFNSSNITNPKFHFNMSLGQGGSGRITLTNYRNLVNNYEEGITLGKLPIGSFNTDSYTNWLTQNALNISLSYVNAVTDTLGGMTSARDLNQLHNATSSGLRSIENNLERLYQAQFIPNQVSGKTNCGDVNYLLGLTGFTITPMSIKQEYAKVIDNYFSMYGYKTNRVKLPNLSGRRNWNYVKTIGANIEGNIPQTDIEELKSIFNNGVTLWHNPSTYLDYSQNNGIV